MNGITDDFVVDQYDAIFRKRGRRSYKEEHMEHVKKGQDKDSEYLTASELAFGALYSHCFFFFFFSVNVVIH